MVRERSIQYRKSTTELQRLTTLIFFLSGGHFSVTFPHPPPTTTTTNHQKEKTKKICICFNLNTCFSPETEEHSLVFALRAQEDIIIINIIIVWLPYYSSQLLVDLWGEGGGRFYPINSRFCKSLFWKQTLKHLKWAVWMCECCSKCQTYVLTIYSLCRHRKRTSSSSLKGEMAQHSRVWHGEEMKPQLSF